MTTFEDERRRILQDVASGEVSPTDAAERLAELDDRRRAHAAEGQPSGGDVASRVRIVAAGFPARVIGDPSVREVVAEGPFVLERDGDTVVITADAEHLHGAFAFAMAGGRRSAYRGRHELRGPLVVRMNPSLALMADVTAGAFSVRDVKGPLTLSVSAGGLRVSGFAAPIDLDVTAGSLTATGVLDRGQSRLRCSAGSARVVLERGSSVRVRGNASAGRLVLPDVAAASATRRGRGLWIDEQQECVVGDGAGQFDVEVATGRVTVRSEA